MPWANVSKRLWPKMERCVRKVMADKDFKPYKGRTKEQSVNALCYTAIMGKKEKKYARKIDRKMHSFGDIDEGKQKIRVNPKKGDLINTVIHEELHKKYPQKSEKWIDKRTEQIEKKLTIPRAIKLLRKYA